MRASRTNKLLDALITDPEVADAMIGDLTQGRAELTEKVGAPAARRWHVREVVRSVPVLMVHRLRQTPARVLLAALLLGPLIMVVVEQLVRGAGWVLAERLQDGSSGMWLPAPVPAVAGLLGGVAAGALIARMSRRACLATALWITPGYLLWILAVIPLTLLEIATGRIDSQNVELFFPIALPFRIGGLVLGAVLSTMSRRSAQQQRRSATAEGN